MSKKNKMPGYNDVVPTKLTAARLDELVDGLEPITMLLFDLVGEAGHVPGAAVLTPGKDGVVSRPGPCRLDGHAWPCPATDATVKTFGALSRAARLLGCTEESLTAEGARNPERTAVAS